MFYGGHEIDMSSFFFMDSQKHNTVPKRISGFLSVEKILPYGKKCSFLYMHRRNTLLYTDKNRIFIPGTVVLRCGLRIE